MLQPLPLLSTLLTRGSRGFGEARVSASACASLLSPAGGAAYAFLPTEHSTGLPLHINADFFPESDRKAVIFKGHQHEHAWNEMLIDAAAIELARDPVALRATLGNAQFWRVLSDAYGSSPDLLDIRASSSSSGID